MPCQRSVQLLLCILLPLACFIGVSAQETTTEADDLETLTNELVDAGINRIVNANTGASSDLQGIATSLNDLIPDFQLSINGDEVGNERLVISGGLVFSSG